MKQLLHKWETMPLNWYIAIMLIIWRLHLEYLPELAKQILPVKGGFLASVPYANFDGIHYLSIAEFGYAQFEQAFFPSYPLLIRLFTPFTSGYVYAGLLISNVSLVLLVYLLSRLMKMTIAPKNKGNLLIKWTVTFLLFSPTSFFFGSVYTESLFLLLVLGCFYAIKKRQKVNYFILGSFASATKLVGSFLLVPTGLLMYMVYLFQTTRDPLFFIHSQPAFGANRSGGGIILLPQVFWRYIQIFLTVPTSSYDFWIAVLEFISFNGALILLIYAWKQKIPKIWILFSFACIIGPTLTGSLSSMPRYILAAFPIFIALAKTTPPIRYGILITNYLLFFLLTMLFTRGWWVS